MNHTPSRTPPLCEGLESRRLLAGEPWGAASQLVRLDQLTAQYATLTGAGQAIAVIDTGIDYTHPALGGGFGPAFKVVDGWDFVDNDPDPLDTHGHGTGIAGVIAADEFVAGGFRYRGVAPATKLVALRVTDGVNPSPDTTMESALRWVLDNRVRLNISAVNLSLGYGHYDQWTPNVTFGDEIAQLVAAGVLVVAASGNSTNASGPGMMYPAIDPDTLSVGAVDRFDLITEFTQRTATLDLLAPGTEVGTTGLGGNFVSAEGTSFAAPFVSGAIALLKQVDPTFGSRDLLSILRVSGTDNLDGDAEFGNTTSATFPRLDLFSAVKLAETRRADPAVTADLVGQFGNGNTLARDDYGLLHFAWFDSSLRTLRYAVQRPSGAWSAIQSPDNLAPDQGQYVSIAFDQRGRPAMAYFDGFAGDLRYAIHTGEDWQRQTVDSRMSVGLYPTLLFGDDNQPIIAYYFKSSGDLRVARGTPVGWNISTIDVMGDVGRSGHMVRDNTGALAIAYEDSTNGSLKLARQAAARWNLQTVDATTRGVAFISLAFDSANRPAISYYDASPADLKFARFQPNNAWHTSTLSARGAVGLYSQLWLDEQDGARILFYNRTRNQLLEMRQQAGGAWSAEVVRANAGRYIAGTVDPNASGDREFLYAAYDQGPRKLTLDRRA